MTKVEKDMFEGRGDSTFKRLVTGLYLAASQSCEERRVPARSWLYSAMLLALDSAGWTAIYLGFSGVFGNYYGSIDVILPLLLVALSIGLVGGYNPRSQMASLNYATEHLIACTFGLFAAAIAVYVVATFGGGIASSRGVFLLTFFGFAIFSLYQRRYFWFTLSDFRQKRSLLVIGDARLGANFYSAYAASGQDQKLHLVATNEHLLGTAVAGQGSPIFETHMDDLAAQLEDHPENTYEAILVAAEESELDQKLLSMLAKVHFRDLPVYSLTSFYEAYWEKMPVHLLNATWPLQEGFHLVKHSAFSSLKRLLDIGIALAVLILTAPLMLAAALAVKMSSRGPVIFAQTRVGQHGEPFMLYKFRTMVVGSETKGIYTEQNDPRVTRVGQWLRKSRLDELPQLLNVLRGDMSMIGPRAEWIKCVERYETTIPHYHFRHLVRPGITGWAQVNYPYGASDADAVEKLMYDLYYIRNFSLNLDASVILKTLHVILFGKGR